MKRWYAINSMILKAKHFPFRQDKTSYSIKIQISTCSIEYSTTEKYSKEIQVTV
jgi:hypothetical protein